MTEIVITRLIGAPPSTVYSYFIDQEKWARWQGSSAELTPSVGGLFSMFMPNGLNAQGAYVELVPNEKVVFTWGWVGNPNLPPGQSTVTVVLEAVGTSTRLTLTHSGLPTDEVPIHKAGWDHYLPRLEAAATGSDPGPDTGPG